MCNSDSPLITALIVFTVFTGTTAVYSVNLATSISIVNFVGLKSTIHNRSVHGINAPAVNLIG